MEINKEAREADSEAEAGETGTRITGMDKDGITGTIRIEEIITEINEEIGKEEVIMEMDEEIMDEEVSTFITEDFNRTDLNRMALETITTEMALEITTMEIQEAASEVVFQEEVTEADLASRKEDRTHQTDKIRTE